MIYKSAFGAGVGVGVDVGVLVGEIVDVGEGVSVVGVVSSLGTKFGVGERATSGVVVGFAFCDWEIPAR